MSRKDLQHIKLKKSVSNVSGERSSNSFDTAEEISLKPEYSKEDIQKQNI
jgi:hypothetical protein